MSSSDSHSLTYESILESFVSTLLPPKKAFKCYYNECDKCFTTQSRLDEHKRRRHAVQDITPREPIVSSTDARDQSTTATDVGQQQPNATPVANLSTTSSPDSQSLDNMCDDDTNGTELVDTIPMLNTGQTLPPIRSGQQLATTSLVDSNPCLNTINTNTGHTSVTANPLQTSGQTVVDLPATHKCLIGGCGLEFYIKYTLIAHQRAVHKTTAQDIHFRCDTSGVGGSHSAVGLGVCSPKPDAIHECKHCHKTYATKRELKKHRRTVHSSDGKAYGCAHNGCGLSFATIPELKKHRLSVHSATGRQYRCDRCDKTYHSKQRYDKHRLTVHSTTATEALHKITAQDIHFGHEKSGVNSDRPIETTTVLPVQSITATSDTNNSDMDSDLEVIDIIPAPKRTAHTVPVRPISDHTSKRLLIDNETSGHTNSYLCDVEGCGGVFVWKYDLDLHQAIAHKVAVRLTHPCGQCEQSFDSVDQWADHMLARHRGSDHTCDKCPKVCNTWRQLIDHQNAVHSQPTHNSFTCSQCDRQFVTQKKLIRHQKCFHSLFPRILRFKSYESQ
ncbi:unnamed protein product [Medioppia subpectinata]|uniref:C2H2-type domain-containing protein n=1 Tax=Medioppia subpectinata TaxID=1979941 RepID=A0A7R9Q7C2_9ACAR|nr:unnamed protein product [Medioppia subpectinata]CAG2115681.1 unnamed protein product [Medioppia subpectinata]